MLTITGNLKPKIEIYSKCLCQSRMNGNIIQRTEQGNKGYYYKVLILEIESDILLYDRP